MLLARGLPECPGGAVNTCTHTMSVLPALNRWTMQPHEWWQTKKWPTLTQTVSARLQIKLPSGLSPSKSALFPSLSAGWKLNPVVGAVYGPELYAGEAVCLFPTLSAAANPNLTPPPHRLRVSSIGSILNRVNMKFPVNQSESESGSDKQWMIRVAEGGWAIVCAVCNCKARGGGRKKMISKASAPATVIRLWRLLLWMDLPSAPDWLLQS